MSPRELLIYGSIWPPAAPGARPSSPVSKSTEQAPFPSPPSRPDRPEGTESWKGLRESVSLAPDRLAGLEETQSSNHSQSPSPLSGLSRSVVRRNEGLSHASPAAMLLSLPTVQDVVAKRLAVAIERELFIISVVLNI